MQCRRSFLSAVTMAAGMLTVKPAAYRRQANDAVASERNIFSENRDYI